LIDIFPDFGGVGRDTSILLTSELFRTAALISAAWKLSEASTSGSTAKQRIFRFVGGLPFDLV
jgi:hypothetical protein